MYENKLKFPGGRGVQNKKPSKGGEYGYFLELHNVVSMLTVKISVLSLIQADSRAFPKGNC